MPPLKLSVGINVVLHLSSMNWQPSLTSPPLHAAALTTATAPRPAADLESGGGHGRGKDAGEGVGKRGARERRRGANHDLRRATMTMASSSSRICPCHRDSLRTRISGRMHLERDTGWGKRPARLSMMREAVGKRKEAPPDGEEEGGEGVDGTRRT